MSTTPTLNGQVIGLAHYATRHFIDSRQTRKPGVAPSEAVLMLDTVHGYYVHGYYFAQAPRVRVRRSPVRAPEDNLTGNARRG